MNTSLSQTKKYRVLGNESTQGREFTYYAQPVTAKERSPIWEDLFSELAGFGKGKGQISGVLCDNGELLATASDVHIPHFYMADAQLLQDDGIKACLTFRKDKYESDSPQTHDVQISLGRYANSDVEEQCAYAEATGDYLYNSLPDRRDTMTVKIEVLVDRFETVFLGPLADYPEAKPLLGKLSQGEKKE